MLDKINPRISARIEENKPHAKHAPCYYLNIKVN